MRISWVHPELAARAQAALKRGHRSWEAVVSGERIDAGAPPEGVDAAAWPALAEHVARGERVREVVAQSGFPNAERRFAKSSHAVERAALAAARLASPGAHSLEAEAEDSRGVLACAIDEHVAYGHFLSRLAELCATSDAAGTIGAFEQFIAAAAACPARDASWPERLHAAQDGLASLYVRGGRADDAEALYRRRHDEDQADAVVAISAARAFLEAGLVARAVAWLELGAARARGAGRDELAQRLEAKQNALRARLH